MTAVMEARGVRAGYGAGLVLHDLSFAVHPGEAVGLMGRNGMGKTTLIRAMLGLLPLRAGSVMVNGTDVTREAPFRRARRGIAVVPEGRGVFASLTVWKTCAWPPGPAWTDSAPGRWTACWTPSPACSNGSATAATSCPAASSRCWRLAVP